MSTDDASGNRWEPGPPTASGEDPTSEQPMAAPHTDGADRREGLPVVRGWFAAGAATVVFIVGGAAGFLVGHTTATSTQDRDPFGQQGPRNGFGPGGGGQLPGQPPGTPPRSDRGNDGGQARGSNT